jgi:rare lipoprotein A
MNTGCLSAGRTGSSSTFILRFRIRNIAITASFVLILAGALASCGTVPALQALSTQEGLASYYSNDFQGRKTSSGAIFDNRSFTAAHRSYPFGTRVRVTNLKNHESVIVTINDRGPKKPERVIDLTFAAAKQIGMEKIGLAPVRIEVLEFGEN